MDHSPLNWVTIWRTTNPKEKAFADHNGESGTVLRADGAWRPLKVGFYDKQELWFWHADVAPVPNKGDLVTIVRARDPKEAACVGHIGQTGTVLRTDGKGRPYQVGFDQLVLWFWPGDVFPQVATAHTRARCYLVPDEESQKMLGRLGFDLRAPHSSFEPDEKVQANPTYFGGAHVTVLEGVAKLIPDCYRQLQVAAHYCREKKWQLPKLNYHKGNYQPGYYFDDSDPHTMTLRESAILAVKCGIGWSKAKQAKFHMGLYSSSLEEKPSEQVCEKMKAVLMKAQWGFVLVKNHGGDDKNYFFDWSTWEKITAH